MAALRPIGSSPNSREEFRSVPSSADREAVRLFALQSGAYRDIRRVPAPVVSAGSLYAGSRVASKMNLRGGTF